MGWVNELIARLTNSPVQDETQTNHTLDSSPITFPLNRTLYADFSHDDELIAIYSAIGLFSNQPKGKTGIAMDPTSPDPQRTWLASHLVPFSATFVTERLECEVQTAHSGFIVRSESKKETYGRMLVNDAVQALEFCGADEDGLCTLDAFVESQSYARSNGDGDFGKCFS